jgi:hypothetical protein
MPSFFALAREIDITVAPHGRIQINQIMLYEVKNGQIVLEQFIKRAEDGSRKSEGGRVCES